MTPDPNSSRAGLAAAYLAHASALERGARELDRDGIESTVPGALAGMTRDVVALTLSTQLLEQVSWLERPSDPLPDGVLELATSNVLRLCATIVASLDHALRRICRDEHQAAMWTIEALRTTEAAFSPDRTCTLGLRFSADTSAELMELGAAIGRASVAARAPAADLAPLLTVALGRAMTIFIATERLEGRSAIG